jgi:hypothetical protein
VTGLLRLGVVAAVALAMLGPPGVASAAPTRLRVVTGLDPASLHYGDPVTATVEVDYGAGGAIDPSSIDVTPSFIPFVVTSPPLLRRPHDGALTITYTLVCLTEGCLPTHGPRLVKLRPVTVTARAGTRTVRASGTWPALRVASRLTASDLSGPVRFRSPTTPPPPTYRVGPGVLAGGLIAAAVICAVAALGIAAGGLTRFVRRSRTRRLSLLEVAIAYVRDSTRRPGPDRRRALSLLAEATDEGEPALAAVASEAAWSRPSPTTDAAAELADRASRLARIPE